MTTQLDGVKFARTAVCALGAFLWLSAAVAYAQDGVLGKWEIAQDFAGQTNYSELKIEKGEGTALKGTWNGEALSDVKLAGDKLTFVRTVNFGGNENKMNYSGTLKEGKLTGAMTSDFGEFPSTARRAAPLSPAVGAWKIADGQILRISQDADAKLSGKLGQRAVSDLKFDGGKLAFKSASKAEGQATTSTATFEGTVKEGKLEGTLKGDAGEKKVSADALGAKLAGVWQLSGDFQFGAPTRKLVVFPDLTARYQLFDGLNPVGDVKLDGDQVVWQLKSRFGENEFTTDFKGKLDGDKLNGQITTPQGANEVKGTRVKE